MSLKVINKTILPKCDLCDNKAYYDVKLKNDSRWANLCPTCYGQYGSNLGYEFNLVEQMPDNGQSPIDGIEKYDLNDLIMDLCDREIACPLCNKVRRMEIDAEGEYLCYCGQKITYNSII